MQIVTPEMPKERVGFLIPRWTEGREPVVQGIPFRCLTVAGALHGAGYEVVFFDQELDFDRCDRSEELRTALAGVRIAFVWMNELDPLLQARNSFAFAQHLKAWWPEIRVAVGGEFVSICPPEFLQIDSQIDFWLQGYGEESAVELVEAVRGERSLEDVSGLVWKNGAHRANAVRTPARIRPEQTALYRLLDLSEHAQRGGIFGNDEPTFHLGTARGCAKRCRFCYWHNHRLSFLPPEEIVDLARHLRERYGVRQFHLAELDFLSHPQRAFAMARLWKAALPDCRWFTLVSPIDAIRLDDEQWDLLAAGGCAKLELGTESGSAHALQILGKRHDPLDPLRINERLLRRGIHAMHNFVFGFPGERTVDRRESLRLIEKLRQLDGDRITFTFRFYQPTWANPLGEEALATVPDLPKTIDELERYRPFYGAEETHAMKWLAEADEKRVKQLVYYYLPIATSKLRHGHLWRRALYRLLRKAAQWRLRSGAFAWPLDRRMYRALLGEPLDNTFTP